MNENIKLIPYDKGEPKKGIVLDPTKCQKIFVPNMSDDARQCRHSKGKEPGENFCPQHALKIEKNSLRR